MGLRRGAKKLALKSISSPLGGSSWVGGAFSRALKLDYGPFGNGGQGPDGEKAVACFSIDFDVTETSRAEGNRKGTLALLELARRYDIPITWAVCGKTAEEDGTAFGAILDASPPDEVGVHTYSHMDATKATPEQFRDDVKRCLGVIGAGSPRTFIFPWNREAHFQVLRELGFRCYRGARRAIGSPVMNEGIWNIRPVYYVDQKSEGAQSLIKDYVDLAIKRRSVFHIWSHPWSLVSGGDAGPMMKTLESVFEHMSQRRSEKSLATLTTGEISSMMDVRAGNTGSDPPEPKQSQHDGP